MAESVYNISETGKIRPSTRSEAANLPKGCNSQCARKIVSPLDNKELSLLELNNYFI